MVLVEFRNWLASQGKTKNTIKTTKNYAIKYGHILDSGDASVLMTLSPRNRRHALGALANLARYQGRYVYFVQIRQNYALKWSSGNNSFQTLQRFFNPDLTLDSMLQRIKEMMCLLPPAMSAVIRYACMVGLRPAEVCESVRLLNSSLPQKIGGNYYNPERQELQHYKFPQLFLRTTKKAYISYITLDNLQPIVNLGCKPPTWSAIRMACYHKGIKCDFRYSRKIFASWLIKEGIDATTVDMLQGRCPTSVLARHYQVPDSQLRNRVLDAVARLGGQISF